MKRSCGVSIKLQSYPPILLSISPISINVKLNTSLRKYKSLEKSLDSSALSRVSKYLRFYKITWCNLHTSVTSHVIFCCTCSGYCKKRPYGLVALYYGLRFFIVPSYRSLHSSRLHWVHPSCSGCLSIV